MTYAFFAAIMVVTLRIFIQLLFIRTVKTDDSPVELRMPWAMANLWDTPENYFPPAAANLYRPWRIIANVLTPIALIAIAVTAIVISLNPQFN